MREGAVSGLERLMRGEIAQAAREALERLAGDKNPHVADAAARVLGIGEKSPQEEPASPPPPPVIEKTEQPDVLTITSPIHLELVRVPAGEFLMGSDPAKDKDARNREQPQHTIDLPEFAIGKYPITNVQYAAFVQAADHRAPKHWEGEIPSGKEDHPVVYVSWNDAMAFCEWLSRETGKGFVLPSEAEWEKAARGADGRIYPWGDEIPTAELCNFSGNVGDTTPLGNYSLAGDSPYKCADMAGNVWEWTRSLWGTDWSEPDFGYPYDSEDGRENLEAGDDVCRVLRGGAFYSSPRGVRCAYRARYDPYYRRRYGGFRVVVSRA
jgi:serine/threonine-protein kinase